MVDGKSTVEHKHLGNCCGLRFVLLYLLMALSLEMRRSSSEWVFCNLERSRHLGFTKLILYEKLKDVVKHSNIHSHHDVNAYGHQCLGSFDALPNTSSALIDSRSLCRNQFSNAF